MGYIDTYTQGPLVVASCCGDRLIRKRGCRGRASDTASQECGENYLFTSKFTATTADVAGKSVMPSREGSWLCNCCMWTALCALCELNNVEEWDQ